MDCPKCGADGVRVVESRKDSDTSRVRRRRCVSCNHDFFSVEVELPTEAVRYTKGANRPLIRVDGYKHVNVLLTNRHGI